MAPDEDGTGGTNEIGSVAVPGMSGTTAIIGALIGGPQRDSLGRGLRVYGAFGSADFQADHARWGILRGQTLEFGYILRCPLFTTVAIAE